MEEKIKKIKSLLSFYKKNDVKIRFLLVDHRRKIEGKITQLRQFFTPFVVVHLEGGDPVKIFMEDIDAETIFPASLRRDKDNRKTISPKVRLAVFKRDGFACVKCGANGKTSRLEVDHKIPVSQGGSNELNNLQTLCMDCNRGKGGEM